MKIQAYFNIFCLFCAVSVYSQKPELAAFLIPAELKENANAVIRSNEETVTITSQDEMESVARTVVTILNEQGLEGLNFSENFDKTRRISKIELRIYDAQGNESKVYKRKDFKDVSVGDGFSVFNDNRMLYVNHTPISYPFTAVFEREIHSSNTAFIPPWYPVSGYFVSTQKDVFSLKYDPALGFAYKELNFSPKYNIEKKESPGFISYSAAGVKGIKGEDFSPEFTKLAPMVYFKVEHFSLEGVEGQASNWKDFGKWYYDNLLTGTDEVPVATQARIRQLVGNEKDPAKIARIVYKYVQDKTRYVSIQVGIGGFKPMLASDVDKLGYGDCKALANYTRALLEVVGVTSYYTIVSAGAAYRKGLQADFASVQGNHIILALPVENDYVWMECTSQLIPFGFQGTFTDNRDVLVVKPEGGEIVRTKSFLDKDNSQLTKGTYQITPEGSISGNLSIVSTGSQYDSTYDTERESEKDKEAHYKRYFGNINSLKIEQLSFSNDRDKIQFTQNIALSAPAYATTSTDRLMFVLNAFNQGNSIPKRYRNRENPFQVNRGFFDDDEITISLPEGYTIEAMPSDVKISNKYGEYYTQITQKDEKLLVYKRTLLIKDGFYPNTDYEEYRQFREQVARNDNAKIVLAKK